MGATLEKRLDLKKAKDSCAIAFYNVENLFDTRNNPHTFDDDFLPDSNKKWNENRFRKKIKKLGRVIANIGRSETQQAPVLIGLAEVENEKVLQDLIQSKFLKEENYNYIHFDSLDERGIDTALLYREDCFSVNFSKAHSFSIVNETGDKDYTRDVLHVEGVIKDTTIHVLVNHWPSRRSGVSETAYKRMAASEKNKEVIAQIIKEDSEARIIVMGDFNDNPNNESVKNVMTCGLYNPMEILLTKYQGTLNYKGDWNLFDQILMSYNFLKPHSNSFQFQTAKIYHPKEIQQYKGRFKGNPFRTYLGNKYLGGFSDHFPVYTIFTINS